MLSIIVPVFDEHATLGTVLATVSAALSHVEKEIVVVDDGSRDGSTDWLKANFPVGRITSSRFSVATDGNLVPTGDPGFASTTIRVVYHDRNRGKGAALRSGLAAASGETFVIQDADLEYDPADWSVMYDLIARRKLADAVFGSRFYGRPHRSLYFHHYLANRLISLLFNVLYNQTLTDIECCTKMFSRQVKDRLVMTCDDFGCEVQLTAQICRPALWRIYEVGISYYGRTYQEGKKIDWRDGMKAIWYVFRFRFAR